jgi:HSP20 family protein
MEDAFRNVLMAGRPVQARIDDDGAPVWRPPIEVYETTDALIVMAELAGMTEDAMQVSVDDAIVSIRGERLPHCDDARRSTHEMSISYGPFAADVFLPFAVDSERASARYEQGLLRVELPRQAGTRIRVDGTTRKG